MYRATILVSTILEKSDVLGPIWSLVGSDECLSEKGLV